MYMYISPILYEEFVSGIKDAMAFLCLSEIGAIEVTGNTVIR